jgi:hypothetical protein
MKKHLGLILVFTLLLNIFVIFTIFVIIFGFGESWEDMSAEETEILYGRYLSALENDEIDSTNFHIYRSEFTTDPSSTLYYELEVFVRTEDDVFEMSEKTYRYEKYYQNGYLYTFDKENNTKTKNPCDFDIFFYQQFIDESYEKIKTMTNEKYYEEMQGVNAYEYFHRFWMTYIVITLSPDKLVEDGLLAGLIRNPDFVIYFNQDQSFQELSYSLLHDVIFETISIGTGISDSVNFPDDLDDYT